MMCPVCGEIAGEWDRYCWNCATRLNNRPPAWMPLFPVFLVAVVLLSLWLAHH
jgi:predicted amidophosphoribosyltransferase